MEVHLRQDLEDIKMFLLALESLCVTIKGLNPQAHFVIRAKLSLKVAIGSTEDKGQRKGHQQ